MINRAICSFLDQYDLYLKCCYISRFWFKLTKNKYYCNTLVIDDNSDDIIFSLSRFLNNKNTNFQLLNSLYHYNFVEDRLYITLFYSLSKFSNSFKSIHLENCRLYRLREFNGLERLTLIRPIADSYVSENDTIFFPESLTNLYIKLDDLGLLRQFDCSLAKKLNYLNLSIFDSIEMNIPLKKFISTLSDSLEKFYISDFYFEMVQADPILPKNLLNISITNCGSFFLNSTFP